MKTSQGNQVQAVQIAYIAGIIDGEGTIRINKIATKRLFEKTRAVNPVYQPHLSLGMVDKRVPERLCKVLGGNMRYERPPMGKNRRGIWRWEQTGRYNVIRTLKALYPYFIVKKEQAIVLLDLCENWEIPSNRKRRTSPEEVQRREELYQKIKKFRLDVKNKH